MNSLQDSAYFPILTETLIKTKHAVCILNDQRHFSFCNEVMGELIGIPHHRVTGRYLDDVLKEAHHNHTGVILDHISFSEWLDYLRASQETQKEHEFTLHTADNKYYKIYRLTVSSGDHVVFGTEITELVETQEELKDTLNKLDTLAKTCDLLGIPNRRHLMESAKSEFARAKRYDSDFAVVLADIDHFKRVNDTYGHHAGDKAIIHFAQTISNSLRESDMIGRLGGEEFAILLPNTNTDSAYHYANRIRQAIEQSPLTLESGEIIHLTSSFGVSEFFSADSDESDIFCRADEALYQAKEKGRNRVCR